MLDRKIILKTERLYLHELSEADAHDIYELNSDPEVVRYTGDLPFRDEQHARLFIQNYDDYARTGIGRWMVRCNDDDTFLGWCGLKQHEDGEIDLGFRLMKRFWNQGFATEASNACISLAFDKLKVPYLIGRVMHENKASIRVLEKLGMRYWKEIICDEHPAICFKLDNPNE